MEHRRLFLISMALGIVFLNTSFYMQYPIQKNFFSSIFAFIFSQENLSDASMYPSGEKEGEEENLVSHKKLFQNDVINRVKKFIQLEILKKLKV